MPGSESSDSASAEATPFTTAPGLPLPTPLESHTSLTSIRVFRRHLKRSLSASGATLVDAAAIHSKACYDEWFNTRGYVPREPFKCFQRTLTAHLTASDGRAPFDPEEEVAIMSVLTQKKQWPAFEGTTSTIGATGFRSTGFHELVRYGARRQAAIASALCAPTPEPAAGARPSKKRKELSATTAPLAVSAEAPIGPSVDSLQVSPCAPAVPHLSAALPDGANALVTYTPVALFVAPGVRDRFPPPPTSEEVTRELAYFEYTHPGWAAVALNTHATSLNDLYLAQSHLSVPWIGKVALSHVGKARALIPAGREPAWVTRALHAQRGGHEVEFTDQLVMVDGTQPWVRMSMICAGDVLLVGMRVI